MSTYYLGAELTWEEYLEKYSFIRDENGNVCKIGGQNLIRISDPIKKLVANDNALSRSFGDDFDPNDKTLTEGFGLIGQPVDVEAAAAQTVLSQLGQQLLTAVEITQVEHQRLRPGRKADPTDLC